MNVPAGQNDFVSYSSTGPVSSVKHRALWAGLLIVFFSPDSLSVLFVGCFLRLERLKQVVFFDLNCKRDGLHKLIMRILLSPYLAKGLYSRQTKVTETLRMMSAIIQLPSDS